MGHEKVFSIDSGLCKLP